MNPSGINEDNDSDDDDSENEDDDVYGEFCDKLDEKDEAHGDVEEQAVALEGASDEQGTS